MEAEEKFDKLYFLPTPHTLLVWSMFIGVSSIIGLVIELKLFDYLTALPPERIKGIGGMFMIYVICSLSMFLITFFIAYGLLRVMTGAKRKLLTKAGYLVIEEDDSPIM